MNGFIKRIAATLLLGLAICQTHMVVLKLFPEIATKEYSLFLDKHHPEKISVTWYIYELTDIIDKIIWAICFSMFAKLLSHRLSNVLIVFILYYITQLVFYIWDRNTVLFSNFIVYLYIVLAVIFLFIPAKKGGKLINIEDY